MKRTITFNYTNLWVYLISVYFVLGFAGCSDMPEVPDPDPPFSAPWNYKFNTITLSTMQDYYYWSDHIPEDATVDDGYPFDFFKQFLYESDAQKGFTYFVSQEVWSNETAGTVTDPVHGFRILSTGTGEFYISIVYPGSVAWLYGVKRGDRFMEVNGNTVPDNVRDLQISLSENVYNTIKFERTDGSVFTADSMGKSRISKSSVISIKDDDGNPKAGKIFDANGKKVGYLFYLSFLSNNIEKLREAIQLFIFHDIDELILDLRYNGGGYVHMAQFLMSLMVKDTYLSTETENKPVIYLKNKKNDEPIKYYFWEKSKLIEYEVSNLGLDRIFILTTRSSASASENIIKGLEPFMDVQQIGSTTYGKPVSQAVFNTHKGFGYNFLLVTHGVFNADAGDSNFDDSLLYFDGLIPDFEISEFQSTFLNNKNILVLHPFGSKDDPLINAALTKIKTGAYPPKQTATLPSMSGMYSYVPGSFSYYDSINPNNLETTHESETDEPQWYIILPDGTSPWSE